MKFTLSLLLLFCVVRINGFHASVGTNLGRILIHHSDVQANGIPFGKNVRYFNYMIPVVPVTFGRVIQDIQVIDLTYSAATAYIEEGGLGFNYVRIRMESDYGRPLNYEVFIYI